MSSIFCTIVSLRPICSIFDIGCKVLEQDSNALGGFSQVKHELFSRTDCLEQEFAPWQHRCLGGLFSDGF